MRIQEDIPVTAMPDLLSHDRILTAEFMKKNREPLSALCFLSAPLTEMLRINCRPGMLKTEKYPLKNRGKLAVTLILFRDIILETCYRNNKTTKN